MDFPGVFSLDEVTSDQRINSKRIHEQRNLESQEIDPPTKISKEPNLETRKRARERGESNTISETNSFLDYFNIARSHLYKED